MSEVVPGLFVGDLEAAQSTKLLKELRVTALLSIGCTVNTETTDLFTADNRASFPDPLDLPETLLMHIFRVTNRFITQQLRKEGEEKRVLVHCRYGQSRSVAVVVAYLLHTSRPGQGGIDEASETEEEAAARLDTILGLVASKRPTLCINPGFLAQLHMLATLGRGSVDGGCADLRLLQFTAEGCVKEEERASEESQESKRRRLEDVATTETEADEGAICCNHCNTLLARPHDLIAANSAPYRGRLARFLEVQLEKDPFWKGYSNVDPDADSKKVRKKDRSGKGQGKGEGAAGAAAAGGGGGGGGKPFDANSNSYAARDEILCAPTAWMQQQLRQAGPQESCALTCPGCQRVCGAWQKAGLALGQGYFRADRFQLNAQTK